MALAELLMDVVVMGLAAGGLASIIRVAAPASWKTRKPVGCPLCMGWWCSLLIVIATYADPTLQLAARGAYWLGALTLLATTAVAAWLNAQVVAAPLELPGISLDEAPPVALADLDPLHPFEGDADTDKERY